MIGIDFHYQSISRGVIDTRDVIYFLSLIVFFLLVTRQNTGKKQGGQKNFLWWTSLLVALVLVNFVASQLHTRADLTEEKRYSLTNTTRRLVRNLKSDLVIQIFLDGEIPSEFRKLSNSAREFTGMVREINPSHIDYELIDPQTEAAPGRLWRDSLLSLGARPINLSVQVKAGEENKIVFPYAVVRSGDRTELVNLFQSSKRNISVSELNNAEAMMEYQFARAIDRIFDPEKPSVAYSVGNGQPQGADAFALWYAIDPESFPDENVNPKFFDVNAKSNYRFGMFNIATQKSIPREIDVLMIVKPATGFTEEEKLKIDQYIMHGGKVLWFIDNLNAEPDSLSIKSQLIAYDRNLNLEDMLFTYGARINPDLVMDLQCDFLPFSVGGSQDDPQFEFLHWNYYPLFESANNHVINDNIGLVAGRFVNSIDTIETAGIKKTILLKSSSNSRTISTPALISPNENRNVAEDALFNKKAIPVAVLLEGPFTSFFRGRISKAQIDSLKTLGGYLDSHIGDNKMIVVADGDIVLNDISSQGPLPMGMNLFTLETQYQYQFANREFLLNCLEYLTSKTNIIETRNKEIILRLLDMKKVKDKKLKWQLINIALPILIVIIFGFIYQQFRRYRFTGK
jgi:gliding-associated putative ABC transporter substrate-binding component GldG